MSSPDNHHVPAHDLLASAGFATLGHDPGPEAVRAVVCRLPDLFEPLDPVDQSLLVEAAVNKLKAAGVTGARRIVEAALRPSETSGLGGGGVIALEDPEPWPAEVAGAALLNDLRDAIDRHVVVPDGGSSLMAMWILHAHAHEASDISPLLAFSSAVKGCGKTTALTLLHALTPRPLLASNVTAAALFRTVEAYQPTLLVDEADSFFERSDDLRGILNSGHFRSGAIVIRCAGDDNEPRIYSTWAPKAIALIGELPATLAARSVILQMRRVRPDESLRPVRLDRIHVELEPLLRKGARWAADHLEELKGADPVVPDGLRDRQADNARPLLAIADAAGGAWPDEARTALCRLAKLEVDREEAAIVLLADLAELFQGLDKPRLSSQVICTQLGAREDRPWSEWQHGNPITPRQLAKLLRPFDVKPKAFWLNGTTVRGYDFDDLRDPVVRYTYVLDPQGPQGSKNDGAAAGSTIRKESGILADTDHGGKPESTPNLAVLADTTRGNGKEPTVSSAQATQIRLLATQAGLPAGAEARIEEWLAGGMSAEHADSLLAGLQKKLGLGESGNA